MNVFGFFDLQNNLKFLELLYDELFLDTCVFDQEA